MSNFTSRALIHVGPTCDRRAKRGGHQVGILNAVLVGLVETK